MRYPVLILAALLSGCGGSPNDPGVGGVTRSEAQALNDAAEMLDQTEPPPSVLDSATQTPAANPQQ